MKSNQVFISHHHLPPWIRSFDLYRHRRIASKAVAFAFEYFAFLGRVTNPSAKPPFLEDQFVSLSLATILRPVRLGRPYQQHKVPADIAHKVIEVRKLSPPTYDKVETLGGVSS